MKSSSSIKPVCTLAALVGVATMLPNSAMADNLLTNGSFETGDFTGWTVHNLPGSDTTGTFAIGNNITDNLLTPPGPSTPISELPSVGAKTGNYYAVSDSLGPGTHVLLQSFTMPIGFHSLVRLSFDMFTNDWYGGGVMNQNGPLDHNQLDGMSNLIPTQFARVDLLTASADAFSVNTGDVLDTLYIGEDTGYPANPYTHYSFDISSIVNAGDTYQLRFAEVDNQFTLNQGIDNVGVTTQTPEPGNTALIVSLGLSGIAALRRKQRSQQPV